MHLPALSLLTTDETPVALNEVATGRWVLFCYPLTGEPGVDVPRGWDEIPGARGCSQEACSFRDQLGALHEAGVEQVLAVSSDASAYQRELADRLHPPYPLLSDPALQLAEALGLPTFTAQATPRRHGGPQRLYKRLTLVLDQSSALGRYLLVGSAEATSPSAVEGPAWWTGVEKLRTAKCGGRAGASPVSNGARCYCQRSAAGSHVPT